MSPNLASSKFILTMVVVVGTMVLAYLEKDIPSGVLIAGIAAYNGANAYIKGKNGGGNG